MKSAFLQLFVLGLLAAGTTVVGCGGANNPIAEAVSGLHLPTDNLCGQNTLTLDADKANTFEQGAGIYFMDESDHLYFSSSDAVSGDGKHLSAKANAEMTSGKYTVLVAKGPDQSPTTLGTITYDETCG